MDVVKNPLTIFGLPLLLMTFHSFALYLDVYDSVFYFDSIMHFAGGVVSAVSVIGMLGYAMDRDWIVITDRHVFKLLVIGLIAIITIAWEVFELLVDVYFGTHWQPSISDTVKDQVLGVSGAVVVVLKMRLNL